MSILTLMGLIPLVGAIIVGFLPMKPSQAKTVALIFALGAMAVAIIVGFTYDPSSADPFQFVENTEWIPALGTSFSVGIDGIGLILIFLTTGLVPIVIIAGWRDVEDAEAVNKTKSGSVKGYFALMLALEALTIGIFISLDVFLFYVFFEVILIPVYFMIGRYGTGRRSYAAVKFMIYSFLGGMVMLAGLAGLWFLSIEAFDGPNLYLPDLLAMEIDPTWQTWLFWSFFIAFAIKAPMWPVHTWLPDAHVEAPTGGSVVLAAIALKLGAYGFLRFSLPIVPDAANELAPLVITLSLIAVVYIGFVALVQADMKKLVAYSSIAHMGFVTLGFFIFNPLGVEGALVQMISHGFVSGAMFLCIGVLYDRMHSRQIADYGGVVNTMPKFAAFFMLFAMANAGLPGTSGFVGEFMVVLGAVQYSFWVAFAAATTLILGAAYTLWMYKRVVFGAIGNDKVAKLEDINGREFAFLAVLAICTLIMGIYPLPVTEVMHASVNELLQHVATSKL